MNLSGIAVSVQASRFDETVTCLNELPGVEVHHCDPASARLVVVQEADGVDAEVEGLKRIKAISGVMVAELVYHYFAEDDDAPAQPATDLEAASGISDSVLRRLNPNQPNTGG